MRHRFVSAVALVCAAVPAHGEADRRPDGQDDRRGAINLTVENDIVAGTDEGYTSGVRLGWLAPADKPPFWRGLASLPLFDRTSALRHEASLGQTIFTPADIVPRRPDPLDRPYAGFSYLDFGIIGVSPARPSGRRRLDELELTVGIVGPSSLAADTQRLLHRSFGFQRPNGWEFQLRDEPALNLSYRRGHRLPPARIAGLGVDLTPHLGFAVGNLYDYASAGATVRIGADLPDFGPRRIAPAVPGSAGFARVARPHLYAFAGVDARAVLRNIFLDGNSFRSGPRVDKEALVADFELGAVLTWGSVRLSYTHVLRTREFVGQPEPASFGSINLSVAY